jgi:maltose alpha-D-glucosyltransferase/alpha-amylase
VWNQGDAWTLARDYMSRFLEEVDLLSNEALGAASEKHGSFLSMSRKLGQRVAELHRALAVSGGDRAFTPQKIGPSDLAAWRKDVTAQARLAFAAARRARASVTGDDRAVLDRFLAQRRAILARIGTLVPAAVAAMKTRCHGDLHLGQVLVVKDDFSIIDFEGEPARPLKERRAKQCPLRDVAGLLRSVDYVASMGLRERAAVRPESRQALVPWVADWAKRTKDSFLDGYREAIGDCPSYPQDRETADMLIGLFTLEKALYEVGYEAANRPDWIHIPLEGVLSLIDHGA